LQERAPSFLLSFPPSHFPPPLRLVPSTYQDTAASIIHRPPLPPHPPRLLLTLLLFLRLRSIADDSSVPASILDRKLPIKVTTSGGSLRFCARCRVRSSVLCLPRCSVSTTVNAVIGVGQGQASTHAQPLCSVIHLVALLPCVFSPPHTHAHKRTHTPYYTSL
jgi:hypothetical protein